MELLLPSKTRLKNAWSGSFTKNGVDYDVSTQVSVQVAASESAASETGAQNVIGLSNGPADPEHLGNAFTGSGDTLGTILRGQDTGVWNYNTLGQNSNGTAAHEFTHLLGTGDHAGSVLSNTDPTGRPKHATVADWLWGIKEAGDRVNMPADHGDNAAHLERSIRVQVNVSAPMFGWWK